MDRTRFQNPPAEYRIHPFWFWNGDMVESEIEWQIAEMAAKGVGGFFLCARQGMKVPYLSDVWFEKVRYAIEAAKRHGLHVWLYDEYPYPSGIAGGEVLLQHPDAKHRVLSHKHYSIQGDTHVIETLPWGIVISAVATPIHPKTGERLWHQSVDIHSAIGNHQAEQVFQKSGLTSYNEKRFFTYGTVKQLHWHAPQGTWEIDVFLETEVEDFKYYGSFVDPGHKAAMKTFIDLTHERYKKEVGQYFGNTVRGMFTDEIGYLGHFPWSAHVRTEFKAQHGYELDNVLPALVDSNYHQSAKIRYDYFQTLNQLLMESYHKQVHDWCEENELEYVAEVPSMRMTTQLYSHVIGSDSAHDKLGASLEWSIKHYYGNFRSNPKMTSSLALQLGRQRALVECFHSIGWSMTLQDAKWMIDRMAAMGVNFFNFHAFFYTLDALTKHDAPPSQFYQNPYWAHFRLLGDYVGRISYVMTQGTPIHNIALVDPTTTFWTLLGNPLHGFQYMGADDAERARLEQLKEDWTWIGTELLLNQVGYDHLDPDLLATADVSDGLIRIGEATYSTVVLPPMTNLEHKAWTTLKQFLAQDGTVIAIGLLPNESIETESVDVENLLETFQLQTLPTTQYWQRELISGTTGEWTLSNSSHQAHFLSLGVNRDETMEALLKLLEFTNPQPVTIEDEDAKRSFLVECRQDDGYILAFVANQEGVARDVAIRIHLHPQLQSGESFSDEVYIEELDLMTGETRALERAKAGDKQHLQLTFHAYESRLFKIPLHSVKFEDADTTADKPHAIALSIDDSWTMVPQGANAIRFDEFELTFGDGRWWSQPSRVQVKTFIDQVSDVHQSQYVPLEFKQIFGTPKTVEIAYPIQCKYTVDFDVLQVPKQVELLMDKSAISGVHAIFINGQQVDGRLFEPKFFYDHANIACPITSLLHLGRNTLEIDVTVTCDWDGLVDAVFLAGDFGVTFDEHGLVVMTEASIHGRWDSLPYATYPYFSGVMAFKSTFYVDEKPNVDTYELHFSNLNEDFHDLLEVFVNGEPLGTVAWSPYQWSGNTEMLQQGENQLEVRVSMTLVGLLEGRYFDYSTGQLRRVHATAK